MPDREQIIDPAEKQFLCTSQRHRLRALLPHPNLAIGVCDFVAGESYMHFVVGIHYQLNIFTRNLETSSTFLA